MSAEQAPSHDEIATRALAIADRRGGGHGFETVDWAQAERELRLERGLGVASAEERAAGRPNKTSS